MYKILILLIFICIHYAFSTDMLYKRNPDDIYERELVAVSSTVIPLSVLEVSYGLGGKPSEEYKEAYLKKLRKKIHDKVDANRSEYPKNPDTLITIKNKGKRSDAFNNGQQEAKVKSTT